MNMERRRFLKRSLGIAALAALPIPLAWASKPYKPSFGPEWPEDVERQLQENTPKPPPIQERFVEVYEKGEWRRLDGWHQLKNDMIFRLREPWGTIADQGTDSEVCVAEGDSYIISETGVRAVKGEPFTVITHGHPLGRRVRLMKDGVQVGGVWQMDLRTHTMLVDRLTTEDHYHLAATPGFKVPAHRAGIVTDHFDYLVLSPA